MKEQVFKLQQGQKVLSKQIKKNTAFVKQKLKQLKKRNNNKNIDKKIKKNNKKNKKKNKKKRKMKKLPKLRKSLLTKQLKI